MIVCEIDQECKGILETALPSYYKITKFVYRIYSRVNQRLCLYLVGVYNMGTDESSSLLVALDEYNCRRLSQEDMILRVLRNQWKRVGSGILMVLDEGVVHYESEEKTKLSYIQFENFGNQENLWHFITERGRLGTVPFLHAAKKLCVSLHQSYKFCGLIHGRLSPAFVWFDEKEFDIRIGGWNYARRVSHRRPFYKEQRKGMHSQYCSPEQRDGKYVDIRSDIFSLGCCFYWMLCGHEPYNNLETSTLQPLTKLNPTVPENLWKIIEKMIALNPNARYRTFSGIRRDLECISKYFPVSIANWQPGQLDTHEIIQWPHEKLYGRQKDLKLIEDSLLKSNNGNSHLLISGHGKSFLLREFLKKNNGILSSFCVFDLYQNIPMYGIISTIRNLLRYLNSQQLQRFHKIPQFQILRVFTHTTMYPFQLDQDLISFRFKSAFRKFLKFFRSCFPNKQIVLIFDGIDYADDDTISFIEHLFDDKTHRSFILGTYNESKLKKPEAVTRFLTKNAVFKYPLSDVTAYEITSLLADCFNDDISLLQDLGRYFHRYTNGDILHCRELLFGLCEDKGIQYDEQKAKWLWDIKEIDQWKGFKALVNLMSKGIQGCTIETINILKFSSLVGMIIKTSDLASQFSNGDEIKLKIKITEAVSCGWLIEAENGYKFDSNVVRKLAYELNTNPESAHEAIGRSLMKQVKETNSWEKLICMHPEKLLLISFHLNLNKSNYIKRKVNATMIQEFINVNIASCILCYFGNAIQAASKFADIASKLLSDKSIPYSLAYEVNFWKSQCIFAKGSSGKAITSFESLLSNVDSQDISGQLKVMCRIIQIMISEQQYDLAHKRFSQFVVKNPELFHNLEMEDETSMKKFIGKHMNLVNGFVKKLNENNIQITDKHNGSTRDTQGKKESNVNESSKKAKEETLLILELLCEIMPALFKSPSANQLIFTQVAVFFAYLNFHHGHSKFQAAGISLFTLAYYSLTQDMSVPYQLSEYAYTLALKHYPDCDRQNCIAAYIRALWCLEDSLEDQRKFYVEAFKLAKRSHQDLWMYLSSIYLIGTCFAQSPIVDSHHYVQSIKKYLSIRDHPELRNLLHDMNQVGQAFQHSAVWEDSEIVSSKKIPVKDLPFHRYLHLLTKAMFYFYEKDFQSALTFIREADAFVHEAIPFVYYYWHHVFYGIIVSWALEESNDPTLLEQLHFSQQELEKHSKIFKLIFQAPLAYLKAEYLFHSKAPEIEIINQYSECIKLSEIFNYPLLKSFGQLRLAIFLKGIAFKPKFVALQIEEAISSLTELRAERMVIFFRKYFEKYLNEVGSIDSLMLSGLKHMSPMSKIRHVQRDPTFHEADDFSVSTIQPVKGAGDDDDLFKPSEIIQLCGGSDPGSSAMTDTCLLQGHIFNFKQLCAMFQKTHRSSKELIRIVNRFLNLCGAPVYNQNGFVYQFETSKLVCVFPGENAIPNSIRAAIEMISAINQISDDDAQHLRGKVGCGLDFSKTMLGLLNFREKERMGATILSTGLDLSNFFCEFCEKLDLYILTSHRVIQYLESNPQKIRKVEYRQVATIKLPYLVNGLKIYELYHGDWVSHASKPTEEFTKVKELFEKKLFLKCLKMISYTLQYFPNDKLIQFYRDACLLYSKCDLPSTWAGEIHLDESGKNIQPIGDLVISSQEQQKDIIIQQLEDQIQKLKSATSKIRPGKNYNITWDKYEQRYVSDSQELEPEDPSSFLIQNVSIPNAM